MNTTNFNANMFVLTLCIFILKYANVKPFSNFEDLTVCLIFFIPTSFIFFIKYLYEKGHKV